MTVTVDASDIKYLWGGTTEMHPHVEPWGDTSQNITPDYLKGALQSELTYTTGTHANHIVSELKPQY